MVDTLKHATSGVVIFLSEELGDARLRCAQLKKYVDEAVHLVENSPHRDHFFEVAGHLLYSIPDTLLRMSKALDASAMAVSKWEYETTKDQLRPEKVEELESALEDTRVRRVQRREKTEPIMKATEAAQRLTHLASTLESTGKLDTNDLSVLIAGLEGPTPKTASTKEGIAASLRELAAGLTGEKRPAPSKVATTLRQLVAGYDKLADTGEVDITTEMMFDEIRMGAVRAQRMQRAGQYRRAFSELAGIVIQVKNLMAHAGAHMSETLAGKLYMTILRERSVLKPDVVESLSMLASDDKQSRFEEGKPADPTKDMSEEDAAKWKTEHAKHQDEFKSASSGAMSKLVERLNEGADEKKYYRLIEEAFEQGRITQKEFKSLETEGEQFFDKDYRTASDEKHSKFEEGKPADPTENMSEADATKWKVEHAKNEDNFKSAMTHDTAKGRWKLAEGDDDTKEAEIKTPGSKPKHTSPSTSNPHTKARGLVPKINRNKQYASE